MNTLIQAPSQTKRVPLVMDFKTRGKAQEDRIVAKLESLYSGGPVGSAAIGRAIGMQHRQVLKYLHAAKKLGRVKALEKQDGGQIAGWIPANVEVMGSVAEQKARRVAAVVCQLCLDRELVSASRIARHLHVPEGTVARWLTQAERMKLVRSVPYRGWKPA